MYALAVSIDSTGAANATKRDFLMSSSLVTSRWSVVTPAGPAVARARLLLARVRVHLTLKRRIHSRGRHSPALDFGRRATASTTLNSTTRGYSAEVDRTIDAFPAAEHAPQTCTRTTATGYMRSRPRSGVLATSFTAGDLASWRSTDRFPLEPRSTRVADITDPVTYPHPLRRGRRTSWAAAAAAAWA